MQAEGTVRTVRDGFEFQQVEGQSIWDVYIKDNDGKDFHVDQIMTFGAYDFGRSDVVYHIASQDAASDRSWTETIEKLQIIAADKAKALDI